MDGVIGCSYTGLSNGEVVVIFGGSVREYRNNPPIWEVIGYSYTGIGIGDVVVI